MLETASCIPDASTSEGATGSSQSEMGVQIPANCTKPPTAARTVRIATGIASVPPTRPPSRRWTGSRTKAGGAAQAATRNVRARESGGLAQERHEEHPERVEPGQ